MSKNFSERVLGWARYNARSDLPWQDNPTPYRVWVSEIMLQQTQVKTVIPYYQRFMSQFPRLAQLAEAPLDRVLHLWSGLGYYARARNLHRAAGMVMQNCRGELPDTVAELVKLPGIGRSTAGAIVSLALGQCEPILDGNVKRVLARCFLIDGWPGHARVLKQLWALSERLTPCRETGLYNQAMMDIGATLCHRTRPDCGSCPLAAVCESCQQGRQLQYPGKKPRIDLPQRETTMLLVEHHEQGVLLLKRPPSGIWGGLWSLPELPMQSTEKDLADVIRLHLGLEVSEPMKLPDRRHSFSHFHLDIHPFTCQLRGFVSGQIRDNDSLWYIPEKDATPVGMAAPVIRLVNELKTMKRS